MGGVDIFSFTVTIFVCLTDGAFLTVCMLSCGFVVCTVPVTVLDIAYYYINQPC